MKKLAVISVCFGMYDMGGLVTPSIDNATVYPIEVAQNALDKIVKRYQQRGLDTSHLHLIEVQDFSIRDKRLGDDKRWELK